MQPVYDDQKEKTDKPHEDLGVHPERREAEVDDLEKLYNAESAPEPKTEKSVAESKEAEALPDSPSTDTNADWKTKNINPKQRRFKMTKKQGGIAGFLATFAIVSGVVGVIQAPNFIINNLREVMLGNIADLQISQNFKYRRRYMGQLSDVFTKDGRRASKILGEMELDGYKPRFDKNKLVGLELPGRRSGIPSYAIEDHINEYLEVKHPLRSSRWKTKRAEAIKKHYRLPIKSDVAQLKKSGGAAETADDADVAINKAITKEALDDKNSPDIKAEDKGPANGENADDAAQRAASAKEILESDGSLDEVVEHLKAGKSVSELDPKYQKLLMLGDEWDDAMIDVLLEVAEDPSIGAKAFNGVKGLVTSTEIPDKMCTLRKRTKAVSLAARLYKSRALIRYAMVFIRASDQTRIGNVDPKLMSSLMKRTTVKDVNGNSIGASPGFSYALKNKFSKNRNNSHRSKYDVAGQRTGFIGAIEDFFDSPGLDQMTGEGACDVIQNVYFQVGEGVAETGLTIVTGGGFKAFFSGGKEAAKEAVEQGFKTSLKKFFTSNFAKGVGKGVAKEIAFEGIVTMIQVYAEKQLSVPFTGQEVGGELGDILVAGAGTSNKQRSLASGMVPATTAEYVQAHHQYMAWKQDRLKKQSFFSRVLDYKNPDSLAYSAATKLAYNSTNSGNSFVDTAELASKSLASLLKIPFGSFFFSASALSSTAGAQSADIVDYDTLTINGNDFATDPAGNLQPIMRPDIENIDPIANKDTLISSGDIDENTLEPKSEEFKEHMANCVESTDTISILTDKDQSDVKFDCLASQQKTKKFKAHLAYLNMVDDIDSSLFPEEISGSSPSSDSDKPPIGDIVVGDTSNLTCSAGTDAGVGDGYDDGKLYKIRLCNVQGATVNAQIAQNVDRLLNDARAAGIPLGGSGFRTMQSQISLRSSNHCPDTYNAPASSCGTPTARPGYSNHQMGLAIDFQQSGSTLRRSHSGFGWMAANASKYGLKNLPSETWHWSVDGH